MEYIIHGKPVQYDQQECGLYIPKDPLGMDYAAMDPTHLVNTINSLSKHQACLSVTDLRDTAAKQAAWTQTPENIGFPILIGGPQRTPINVVRQNIQNLEKFTQDILSALQGE